jgi:hypothetical protein
MSGGDSKAFFMNLMLLDILFHPVDTLRTRYMADGNNSYRSFLDCMKGTSKTQLFNGLGYK